MILSDYSVSCSTTLYLCRPLAAYNSLMDPHLAGYFSNLKRRKHLKRAGLVGLIKFHVDIF